MTTLGIIGCGHWGKNHVRVFSELPDVRVLQISDPNRAALDSMRARYPLINTSTSPGEILDNPAIEAVVIATPAARHYDLAKSALQKGKHVLCEKPLTRTVAEAEELVAAARSAKRVLMVGHTFLFNNAVRKMKECVRAQAFGTPYYLHARRNHLGLIRQDVDAVWDLAPHDIAIFGFLLDAEPTHVSAMGGRFLSAERCDVAFASLRYPGGVIGNIQVSWVDSNKIREVVAIGSRQRVVFNDLDTLETVKIYDKGVSVDKDVDSYGEFKYLLRDGDIHSPKVNMVEPLKAECEHFLDCVRNGKTPLSDGTNGLAVVRVLVAIETSLARDGAPVEVK